MAGSQDAPEVLQHFKEHLELVEILARQIARAMGTGFHVEELVSFGREGLLEAARRYDSSRGVPFRAYASFRVRGAIIDGVRSWTRLPRRTHERLRALEAAAGVSEGAVEDTLTAPKIGAGAEVERMLTQHLGAMASAMVVGLLVESAYAEEGEVVAVAHGANPEEALAEAELLSVVKQAIFELPEQEGELLRRHYLEGERFDLVAKELGLSKSWASRLHTRALGRLTKRLRIAAG